MEGGGSSALEQFLLLGKSAKGRACAALLEKAISSPSVFAFGELLDMPNVQAVRRARRTRYAARQPS